jgi:hypothetical protein
MNERRWAEPLSSQVQPSIQKTKVRVQIQPLKYIIILYMSTDAGFYWDIIQIHFVVLYMLPPSPPYLYPNTT